MSSTLSDTTRDTSQEPASGTAPRRSRAHPAAVRAPGPGRAGTGGGTGLPARAPGRALPAGLRPRPAVRPTSGVGRRQQLPHARRRRLPVAGHPPLHRLLPRQRGAHDGDRRRPRAADAAHVARRTTPRADRAAARVGDAGRRLAHGVAVALRHAVRRRELRPHRARPRLRGPRVAPAAAVLLLRRDRDRRVDERAVRRVHGLRRAHAAARGAGRGLRDRRRRSGLSASATSCCPPSARCCSSWACCRSSGTCASSRRSTSCRRRAAAPATPTCSAPTSTGSASAAASSACPRRWRSSCSPSPSC